MLNMYKQITVKVLHEQKQKTTEIAKTLHCHRNTVANILKREALIEKLIRHKASVYAPYKDTIKTWFEKDKLTRVRIYEKLQEEYKVNGGYDALRRFIQKHLPQPKEAFGVQEHLPGEEVEVDFGDISVQLTEEGKWRKFQLLAFVLPFSGKKYYELCENQQLETLCFGFQKAFGFYGGVPKKAKVDNLKPVVTTNARYQLEFNQSFLEFARHYRFVINPCTPYSPEQKGTVEGGVKYAQINFVPGRTFKNIEDLRSQLKTWTDMVNRKIHGTTKEVINDRFAQYEKARLQLLPTDAFSFFNRCERMVGANCHIHFANNYYSVPFSYVGKEVTVRWSQAILRIIYQGGEIALHKLCREGVGNYITECKHLLSHKLYSEAEYRQYHEEKMCQIGRYASQYFLVLLKAQPDYWWQTLRPIYGFVQEFGAKAVNKALGRALTYKARDTRIIKHILEGKLYEIVETIEIPVFTDISKKFSISPLCMIWCVGAMLLGGSTVH